MSQSQTEHDKISERLKAVGKAKGLSVEKLMRRYVCETFLSGFIMTMIDRFQVGGGLIHAQTERETDDADIKFIRRHTEEEFRDAFERMTGLLDKLGIRVEYVDPAINLDLPSGSGLRFNFRAWIGKSRVDSHLDTVSATAAAQTSLQSGAANSRSCAKALRSVRYRRRHSRHRQPRR